MAFLGAEAAQAWASAAASPRAVPTTAASGVAGAFPDRLDQVRLPVTHVSVQSLHSGRSGVTILHIQDAHSNLSGQKSLAAALDEIMDRYPVEWVLVEGGSGDVGLDRLKAAGTPEQWERAAGRLLYEGLIAGEEYLNLTSAHRIRLQGVEEDALYRQSLKVYDGIVRHRKETLPYLRRIAIALDRVKNRVYPKELLDHESALTAASSSADPGASDFTVRTDRLIDLAVRNGVGLESFPEVRKLTRLKTAEQRIAFQKAQAEEELLITAAYPDRGGPEFKAYVEARRKARSSPVAQLALLNDLLERSGRPRESLVMLGAYLKYLEDFSRLDMAGLMTEMERLEDTVYREVLRDDEDARMLRVCDRFVGLLQKAYRIRMSSDEFRALKVNEKDLPTPLILGFLNRKLAELGYTEDLTPYETPLEDARYAIELFYRLVDKRDRAFIRNAKAALDAGGARTAVLITGGYHTAHLEKLMRAEDWSYAVLTPIVEYETDQAQYEARLLAPLKAARRKLAAAAGSPRADEDGRGVEASDGELRIARGPAKVRDGLRAQAAAARLAGVTDPDLVRVIRGALGPSAAVDRILSSDPAPVRPPVREPAQAPETAAARMASSDAAMGRVEIRRPPLQVQVRRVLVRTYNWFIRNATLAVTVSFLSMALSYFAPTVLFWTTAGFLALSLTVSIRLARRYHRLGRAQLMSELNVSFQSLLVASVLYAGMGWKNGIDRATERLREAFSRRSKPILVTPAPDPSLTAPRAVPNVPLVRDVTPLLPAAAPSLVSPQAVMAGMDRALTTDLPPRVREASLSLSPLFRELVISESALIGHPLDAPAGSDPAGDQAFAERFRRAAITMAATSMIETGKGTGGMDMVGTIERGGKGRAAGVFQMNGATAKWIITNLISQPQVYLKPFIEASPDPERMRAGIMNLRAAYAEPLFELFQVDPAEGEAGWAKVAEAASALTDDQMRDRLALGDPANPRLDRTDLYRVQYVTARFLMLFKRVEDAETYMKYYNTSVQADPSFKGLTTWVKSETLWVRARLLIDSILEAYGTGSTPDAGQLDRLETELEVLTKAAEGFGDILVQMTRLLKVSVEDPGSAEAPEMIRSIREDLIKYQVKFSGLSQWGMEDLLEQLVASARKDLSLIESRLIQSGAEASAPDLPADLIERLDQARARLGGSSVAANLAYRASDDGQHGFVLHEDLAALARDWMEGKWGNVPLAVLAELTPRDTEAITEPGFTPLLSWMVLSELNRRGEKFPNRPFRMHWVDPQAHYGQAGEFYERVSAVFRTLYPGRGPAAPDDVTRAVDAQFLEFHTNAPNEERPMTIFGGGAGQMVALDAADKPVDWRHLFLTRKVGGAFVEVTSLKRGMLADPGTFKKIVDEVARMFEQQSIGTDGRPVPVQLFIHRATSANGTSSDQLPGLRLAISEKASASPSGARMAWRYRTMSRNALYAPGDAVWVSFYEDRAEEMERLFRANRSEYLNRRAAMIREVRETFARARADLPADDTRLSRIAARAFDRLETAFIQSIPDEDGDPQEEDAVTAEGILVDEMSAWASPTPEELLEGSRILHRIMSGLDQSYFYAHPWFQTRLIRSIPPEESRWTRRADRVAAWLRDLYSRLAPDGPERSRLRRELQAEIQRLELAVVGRPERARAFRASGLLSLLGPDPVSVRRSLTAMLDEEYPSVLLALFESVEPDAALMRKVRNVLGALERVRSFRTTEARAPMRRVHLDDDHAPELEQIQRDIDRLEYRDPPFKHHSGSLTYRGPDGNIRELNHLGSGVFNDVFDWNANYIVRVTRFRKAEDQFEDPELIRGAVAGVDGTGLTPRVIFFGQLRDGRSVQIIERMQETLDQYLAESAADNDPTMIRPLVRALERFAVNAIETGYALEDAHTGNFMLSGRTGRLEVAYSDIDGLNKIGTSPGSQLQVALHLRGQLLGRPHINPWGGSALVIGRPLLRRLNLMIGAYQADRLGERIVHLADLLELQAEQRTELDAIQALIGALPIRSTDAYDWEGSYRRYQPRSPQDASVIVPASIDEIERRYLEVVDRVREYHQKWPRSDEGRWIVDLLLLRAQWTEALRMVYHQYENDWAATSLDRMIQAYEDRDDIRSPGLLQVFLNIGWRRWLLAAAAESSLAFLTWLALGRWEGIGRLVEDWPYLAGFLGVSTTLALTATFMLTARPFDPRTPSGSGARMALLSGLWERAVLFFGTPSPLRREASVVRDAVNVKGGFQDHDADPAKVWSWRTREGRRVYLKWFSLEAEPASDVRDLQNDPLNDIIMMLDREGKILQKIAFDPRYEAVRGYFAGWIDRGQIGRAEAAALKRSRAIGSPVPEGAVFTLTAEIPGQNLREWMSEPRTEEEVVRVMEAVSAAVRRIHEAGIFHGDLGPAEIFLNELPDGRIEVRFSDLGLTVLRGDVEHGLTDMRSRRNLLELVNLEFNADAALWVGHQWDPWRVRDLASLTNLYLQLMKDATGFDVDKRQTAAWIAGLLDPSGSGSYAAALGEYLDALDQPASDGARMALESRKGGWEKVERHLMTIHQELERAGHRTELTVYPAAGADIVSALIVTDARELVLIDRAPLGDPGSVVSEHARREYVQSKSLMGWSPGYLMQNGVLAMIRLELEAFAGIEWDRVAYERVSETEARLTFAWRHPGADKAVTRTVRILSEIKGAEEGLDTWSAGIADLKTDGPKTVFLKAGEYQNVLRRGTDGASGASVPGILDQSELVRRILGVMGPGRQAVVADVPIQLDSPFLRIGAPELVDAVRSSGTSFGYGVPSRPDEVHPPQAFLYIGGSEAPASPWSLSEKLRDQVDSLPASAVRQNTNITQVLRHPEMLLAVHEYAKGSGPLNVMVLGPGAASGRSPMMEEVLFMTGGAERNRYVVIDPNPEVLIHAVQPQFEPAYYERWFSLPEAALPEDVGAIRVAARKHVPALRASKDLLPIEGFAADAGAIQDFGSEQLDLVIAPFALGYALRSVIARARAEAEAEPGARSGRSVEARERAAAARWLTSLVRSLRTGGWILFTPSDLEVFGTSGIGEILAEVQTDLAASGRELVVDQEGPELIVLSVEALSAGARMSWQPSPKDPRVLTTDPFYFADHRAIGMKGVPGVYDGIWNSVFGTGREAQVLIAVRLLDNGDIRVARPAPGQTVSHQDLAAALREEGGEPAGPDWDTAMVLLDRLNGEPVAAIQHASEVTAALARSRTTLREWRRSMAALSMAVHVVEKIARADGHDPSALQTETTLLNLMGGAPVSRSALSALSGVERTIFTAVQASRYGSGELSRDTLRSMLPTRAGQDILWAAGYGLARAVEAGAAPGTFDADLDGREDPDLSGDPAYSKLLAAADFFVLREKILNAGADRQLRKVLGSDLRGFIAGGLMEEEYAFRAALAVRNSDPSGSPGLSAWTRSALRSIERVTEGRSTGRLTGHFDAFVSRPGLDERQKPVVETARFDFTPNLQTWHQRPQLAVSDFGMRLEPLGAEAWIRDDFSGEQTFLDGRLSARIDRLGDVARLAMRKGSPARLKIKVSERNIRGLSSAQVLEVVRQLMIGTEPVEHPVLGVLPAGFLTTGLEISAMNLPDDPDARRLELMDWSPYFAVIEKMTALAGPVRETSDAGTSEAATAASTTAPDAVRLSLFYELEALLEREGGAWIAEPMPERAADADRTPEVPAADQASPFGSQDLRAGPAVMRIVAALRSIRLRGQDPSFVTVLSPGADSAEYRGRAEKTAAALRAALDLGPEAYPVISAAEAADPRYASLRKVHLALDREMEQDAGPGSSVLGHGLNIVSEEDPDSVSMAMVLQTLLTDAAGEPAGDAAGQPVDKRKMRSLAERHGGFLQGIFGPFGAPEDMAGPLAGMFRAEDEAQVRMVRSMPVTGRTLGARLAEALLSLKTAGTSA